ncbi:hypothetical protein [Enterococcus rotai]|uniref:hypothetical protein n=1 Tax=Enterococcus rotai TaxID=118060 RepID=UPI0032B425F8
MFDHAHFSIEDIETLGVKIAFIPKKVQRLSTSEQLHALEPHEQLTENTIKEILIGNHSYLKKHAPETLTHRKRLIEKVYPEIVYVYDQNDTKILCGKSRFRKEQEYQFLHPIFNSSEFFQKGVNGHSMMY